MLSPCETAASAASVSAPRPSRRAIWRRRIISVPTEPRRRSAQVAMVQPALATWPNGDTLDLPSRRLSTPRSAAGRDRGEGDGQGAARPRGHDPEELNGSDRDEHTRCTDVSRQRIGHAKARNTSRRHYSSRISQRRQSIQRSRDAEQRLGRRVGHEPQRRRRCWKPQQGSHRRAAGKSQPGWFGRPNCRVACVGSERRSCGSFCRMTFASWRPRSPGISSRLVATARQPEVAANRPWTAACNSRHR